MTFLWSGEPVVLLMSFLKLVLVRRDGFKDEQIVMCCDDVLGLFRLFSVFVAVVESLGVNIVLQVRVVQDSGSGVVVRIVGNLWVVGDVIDDAYDLLLYLVDRIECDCQVVFKL